MNDMETETQAVPPAFQSEYWAKAPRKLSPPTRVVQIQTAPNGDKVFTLDVGAQVARPPADLRQLILVGTLVQVEIVRTGGGEIVTGLFVPEMKAWAWQMSSQDLADYAKQVSEAVTEHRMHVRLAMTSHLKGAMLEVLNKHNGTDLSERDALAEELAVQAVISLESGPA